MYCSVVCKSVIKLVCYCYYVQLIGQSCLIFSFFITCPINYLFLTFKHNFPNIKLNYTSTKEIQKIIKSLKAKSSYGYDGISIGILKLSAQFALNLHM